MNMLGRRFYDETGRQFTANNYNSIDPYVQGSYLNAKNIKYNPNNWLNAAMAGIGDGHNGGGPIWAIFDADAVAREKWDPAPPNVDHRRRLLLQRRHARPISRSKIVMKYQRVPMPPENLRGDRGALQLRSSIAAWTRISASPRRCYKIAHAALLCRLGDAGDPRHARRLAHQRALPGDGYERRRSSRAFIAAANRPAASASTAWRAPPARATSPASTPPPKRAGPDRSRFCRRRQKRYDAAMRERHPANAPGDWSSIATASTAAPPASSPPASSSARRPIGVRAPARKRRGTDARRGARGCCARPLRCAPRPCSTRRPTLFPEPMRRRLSARLQRARVLGRAFSSSRAARAAMPWSMRRAGPRRSPPRSPRAAGLRHCLSPIATMSPTPSAMPGISARGCGSTRPTAAPRPYATDILRGGAARTSRRGSLRFPLPGHTAGSVAYPARGRCLFTGNSLAWDVAAGDLTAHRHVCWYSWPDQLASLRRLLDHRFDWVLAGHGGSCGLGAAAWPSASPRCSTGSTPKAEGGGHGQPVRIAPGRAASAGVAPHRLSRQRQDHPAQPPAAPSGDGEHRRSSSTSSARSRSISASSSAATARSWSWRMAACAAACRAISRGSSARSSPAAAAATPGFERLVIETTGLADPAPIMQLLLNQPLLVDEVALDAVIATVDADPRAPPARRAPGSREAGGPRRPARHHQDRPRRRRRSRRADRSLAAINPTRRDFRLPDEARRRACSRAGWSTAPAHPRSRGVARCAPGRSPRPSPRHRLLRAYHRRAVEWRGFSRWLTRLKVRHADRLLRVKGILQLAGEDAPVAIHGVHHVSIRPSAAAARR